MQPNLKNVSYPGDVTKMPRIGRLTTKPVKIKYGVVEESASYYIVGITKDKSGKKAYVCDFWYKDGEPYFISESQVLSYISFI